MLSSCRFSRKAKSCIGLIFDSILDTTSLLVRFGYRDYDPNAGRWTARDPIFFKGGQGNLFGYVQNNPINLIDPLGLERWHTPDGNHTVGRPGTIVPPGGGVGTLIEARVGSGWEFGKKHDEFVGKATQCGIPDLIINIPSMIPVYLYSIAKDLTEMPAESKPGYFPLLELRF
jgi:RHS repeat-associated protein